MMERERRRGEASDGDNSGDDGARRANYLMGEAEADERRLAVAVARGKH